jgi:hypothetical protein
MATPPLEPFEVCSIRPPTENFSLTFRLTRNCGWNRCTFCPVYKSGVKFSRRSIDEVKRDIDRARRIDDFLADLGVDNPLGRHDLYNRVADLLREWGAEEEGTIRPNRPETDEDERLAWFASWFKDKPSLEDSIFNVLTWRVHGGETAFLGDADGLMLSADFFSETMAYARQRFPSIHRFTIYGRTGSAVKKTAGDLGAFARAGLHRIHFGIESGSDAVLAFVRKGETAEDHVEACRTTRAAGISPSVYVMPGLGGAARSEVHAAETAHVLTEAEPDYVRLRTLEIFPGTPLAEAAAAGEFAEATEEQVVKEIRTIVANTAGSMTVMSDSASNLLDVSGRLPDDRGRMLAVVDGYLALSGREKLEFSLLSRLQSFLGQYGNLSADITRTLAPYFGKGGIDTSRMPDELIRDTIRLIRSKLMP